MKTTPTVAVDIRSSFALLDVVVLCFQFRLINCEIPIAYTLSCAATAIRCVPRCFPQTAFLTFVGALAINKVDYCWSVILAGIFITSGDYLTIRQQNYSRIVNSRIAICKC